MAAKRALTVAGAVVVASLSATMAAQNKVSLDVLLERGALYLMDYAPRISGVILEEQYMLIEVAGRMMVPQRLSSDVVLIDLNGQIMALRDAYAVDTKPIRERTPRINTLLATPTGEGWNLAQEYARQNRHYFRAELVAHISEPTLALQLLALRNQPKLTYRLDGQKKMNGVAVAGVRFQEPVVRDKLYILGTRGNAAASGRFWIDPETGAVHQTELWMESPTETARIQVNYAPDAALGFILPKDATATFEERELGSGASNVGVGAYNRAMRFESTVKFSNARHMPIDLSKAKDTLAPRALRALRARTDW